MKKLITIGLLICLVPSISFSQKRKQKKAVDSLELVREFMAVCNSYKTLPLQLSLQVQRSSNIALEREDTLTTDAKFYLHEQGGYVRYGELEQVVNDSLMLLVSNEMKRMLLYQNDKRGAEQMVSFIGLQIKDSTLESIGKKFICISHSTDTDTAVIELQSRGKIHQSELPKESIVIRYSRVSKNPYEVVQIQRSLIKISEEQYKSLNTLGIYGGKLLQAEGSFFVIKEDGSRFLYQSIAHNADMQIPVSVFAKIKKDETGNYVPVKQFEDYVLTINF